MERRSFLGTLAALASPISLSATGTATTDTPSTSTDSSSAFDVTAPRQDISLANLVLRGSLGDTGADRFTTAHNAEMFPTNGRAPGHHMYIPVTGSDDDDDPLMTAYPESESFLLRINPENTPLDTLETEFRRLLSDAGVSLETTYTTMKTVNLVATSEVETEIPTDQIEVRPLATHLNHATSTPFTDVSYTPKISPRVRLHHERGQALIFSNKTIVVPGATEPDDIIAIKDDIDEAYAETQAATSQS